jgi:hypothetical protein
VEGLGWSWLAAPYVACSIVVAAVAIAAALIRGDRVMRLGVIGATVTTLPWAMCQALAAMTHDAPTAMRLLKLGQGPVALVGPNLLLVLLAVSGQLERFRWLARIAPLIGTGFLVVAWSTAWIVPGVQLLPSGMFYISPGPLTGIHLTQLGVWLIVGLVIMRRSSPRGERGRTQRMLLGVLVFCAIGSVDVLLLYGVWGSYPIAWLPATIAACIALYLVLRTDLLRPQGFDRSVAIELGALVAATAASIPIALWLDDSPVALVAVASLVWAALMGVAWGIERERPVRVAAERALEQFVARAATLDDPTKIATQLAALWKRAIGIEIKKTSMQDELGLDPDVVAWLARHGEPLAVSDLATMRLGGLRPKLEQLCNAAGLVIPLVDRDELVGLVLADYELALRDAERALIAESARAAARAFTFVGLARAASRERETAREVEVADALRLQASASRDAELGRWAVAAEYRTAPRTTGAGWSAIELADGRLALLATEAQAHGVAAALATAALTGAFAAATTPGATPVTLDELLATMQASSEGVMRGGEPVAAFLAILDAQQHTIEWACAGHPGAFLVGPIATVETSLPVGSGTGARPKATPLGGGVQSPGASLNVATRGTMPLPADTLLVVASSALRGTDDARWQQELRESAPASGRLATVLVEHSLKARDPDEDLLAVVVRSR